MKNSGIAILVFCLAASFAAGCSKKADTQKPLGEIRKEIEGMSLNQLQGQAEAYAREIAGKRGELEKIQAQLTSLSPQELFGDKAKGIKDQMSRVASDTQALTDRYNIYAGKFQELGGDSSKIQIG